MLKVLFIVSVILIIYSAGFYWVPERSHTVDGYLVVPMINRNSVSVENEKETLVFFVYPDEKLSPIIESQDDWKEGHPRTEVTVTYRKNLWGHVRTPEMKVTKQGWIRRPK